MEELKLRPLPRWTLADTIPETLEEADRLAASIEKAVQRETDYGVAGLCVDIGPHGVRLRGRCDSFYTKQLAQHAAMRIPGGDRLINSIEVD
jgi:hypothetical protein